MAKVFSSGDDENSPKRKLLPGRSAVNVSKRFADIAPPYFTPALSGQRQDTSKVQK